MNTSDLFGIQFATNKHYKPRLLEDFVRWKTERQWYITKERNERAVVEFFVKKHRQANPLDDRPPGEIAADLWQDLKLEVDKKDWQKIYDDILGSGQELPDYDGGPFIYIEDVKELFYEYNCTHYYFTETAVEECTQLAGSEQSDLQWLLASPDAKRQINFGDNFIRYEKRGKRIVAMSARFTRRQENNYLQHTFFNLDLYKNQISINRFADPVEGLLKAECEKETVDSPELLERNSCVLLYQMITFLDLLPVKKIHLPAGKQLQLRTSSSFDEVNNFQAFPITIVNASWNCTIYIGDMKVSGHWKEVSCGQGKRRKKKVFVRPHSRKGHERVAKKHKPAGA